MAKPANFRRKIALTIIMAFLTAGLLAPGPARAGVPVLLRTLIDTNNTTVTLVFSEAVLNGQNSLQALKTAITFAPDGSIFNPLSPADLVTVERNTLKIQFETPLTGKANKIAVQAGALISATDQLPNNHVFTDYILANTLVYPGKLGFARASYAVYEHGAVALLEVARQEGAEGLVAVDYTTADGTAVGGKDYQTTRGVLVFNAGETAKTIGVPILDDHRYTGNRSFTVSLSNPAGGATLGATTATVGIIDNDPEVTGLQLNHSSLELTPATAPVQLLATFTPYLAQPPEIVWLSTNPAVARVDHRGWVTPVAPGNTAVLAQTQDGSLTATCLITVNPEESLPETPVDGFITYSAKTGISRYKVWSVVFNQPLDPATVNGEYIYLRDAAGNDFAATVTLGADNRSVSLAPVKLYTAGASYTLYITPGIKAVDGRYLARGVKQPFTVINDAGQAPAVDVTKFRLLPGSDGNYHCQGLPGAVGTTGATVRLYRWTDNGNNVVDSVELAGAETLGTTGNDGSLAAVSIGKLTAGATYHYVVTANKDARESRRTGSPAGIILTVTVPAAPASLPTAAGALTVSPSPGEVGPERQTLTLTYVPGEFLLNGTVIFQLPDGFSAGTDDYLAFPGCPAVPLNTGQISADGKTVTVTGVTAGPGEAINLTLNNVFLARAASSVFQARADADGEGPAKTASPGTGLEAPEWTVNAAAAPVGTFRNPGTNETTTLVLTFNEALHPATTTKTAAGQILTGGVVQRNGSTPVAVLGVAWHTSDPDQPRLTLIIPPTTFAAGDTLDATFVTGVVRDRAGNSATEATQLTVSSLAAPVVTGVTAEDIGNADNGTDLLVTFNIAQVADKEKIANYRVMVVRTSETGIFNLAAANAVTAANYTEAAVPAGEETTVRVRLAAGAKTVDGWGITKDTAYKVYVLSVADGVKATENSLSASTAAITLYNDVSAPNLNATAAPGSEVGTTKITATAKTGNTLAVKVGSTATPVPYAGAPVATGTGVTNPYTSGNDITGVDVRTNRYLAIYEVNPYGNVVAFKLFTLTADLIKQDLEAPTASVTTASLPVGSKVTTARSTEPGTVYLVATDAAITTQAQAEAAVTAGTAKKATVVTPNTDTVILTTGLSAGVYQVMAADAAGNLSAKSTGTITLTALSGPVLTADTSENSVDNNLEISFTDNAAWRAAVTAVKIDGVTLTASGPEQFSLAPGTLTLKPDVTTKLQTPGEKTVTVLATNYADTTVTQTVTAGAASSLTVTEEPAGPAASGESLATQPEVTLKDQYGNICATGPSDAANVTATKQDAGNWTLDGTLTVTAADGVASFTGLTATNNTGTEITDAVITFSVDTVTVDSTTFTIPAP